MEEKKHFKFHQNRECEYFPCHKGVPEDQFNCLFCYCPLYALGKKCGGHCVYTEYGCKSCDQCTFPHWPQNYEKLLERYKEIMDVVKLVDGEQK